MSVKILQVLGRSAGGVARHVAEVTDALDGEGDLTVDIAGPPDLPVPMPKPVFPVTIPNGIRGHRGPIRALKREVAGYDVVHAHGLRAGIDAALAARESAVPVIVTVHNLVRDEIAGPLKALLFRRAEWLVVRLAGRVLAVSRDIADHLAASASDDARMKIEVLHLGIDTARRPERSATDVRGELGIAADAPLVVTASRLKPQKALDVMIEAIAATDCHLAILGEGWLEEELRRRTAALGISDRVYFLGFRHDVADFIAAADVFCLSSVWEGVPLAALEAAALGTPVVATDVGGMGELVTDGVSGRLVPAGDPATLARALDEVLDDEASARRYAGAARVTLEESFDRAKMLDRLVRLYRECAR